MVAMRHGRVTTLWPMDMVLGMAAQPLLGGTLVRVLGIHLNDMEFDALAFLVFQVAGFEIIGMALVLDRDMAATRTVLML